MFIRTYRKPLPHAAHYAGQPNSDPRTLEQMPYQEMFVLLEQPLLEMDREDLLFLKGCGIAVTAC